MKQGGALGESSSVSVAFGEAEAQGGAPCFSLAEVEAVKKLGVTLEEGWILLPNGKRAVPGPLARQIPGSSHGGIRWGTRALCDHFFLKFYGCIRIFEIRKQHTQENCNKSMVKLRRVLGAKSYSLYKVSIEPLYFGTKRGCGFCMCSKKYYFIAV